MQSIIAEKPHLGRCRGKGNCLGQICELCSIPGDASTGLPVKMFRGGEQICSCLLTMISVALVLQSSSSRTIRLDENSGGGEKATKFLQEPSFYEPSTRLPRNVKSSRSSLWDPHYPVKQARRSLFMAAPQWFTKCPFTSPSSDAPFRVGRYCSVTFNRKWSPYRSRR
jgi:hypothetical protein